MPRATGTFEVSMKPQDAGESPIARMSLDKQFQGDLEAASQGEMLAFMTEVKGSAGYVAMERVTGTLHDRTGTFVLQHSGTMTRGEPRLSVTVVPDSGTEELAGLAGNLAIRVEAGKHFYNFEYSIG